MRRLWSHIILAATSLIMVGATFASVVGSTESNIEFNTLGGKEMVFRINGKDDDKNINYNYTFSNTEAVNEIAGIMESRLQTANVTRYKVETQGYDTIKVTFVGSDNDYQVIPSYLTFDATLALSNSKDNVAYAEEFLTTGKKARLEITEGYPQIIIPIDSENERFKAVYEEAKKMAEDGEGEVVDEHSDDEETAEGEEHEHQTHAYLYLWYNYVKEYYSYSKYKENDPSVAGKVLMTFDSADPFYDEEHTALRAIVNAGSNDDGTVTAAALKQAYETARYYVNLLNAESLNYYVTYLFSNDAPQWVENLLYRSDNGVETLAWGRTFIATLCAVVVVSLLLVYFYRLGALSIATTSIVSTFFGLLFIVIFAAEFNVAGIVGLVSLAFTSVASGIIYLNKFKEECYRGRSLKKANAEGAKKAVLPTVDIHVVLIAVGLACYLLGGALLKSFAVSAILGGLVSLALNLAGLRGLMWLVTNEQGLANRYDLFDISKEQIPNSLEGEKQQYFGPNADKDFTKKKKPIAILGIALFVASITGMIVFGAMNKGAVYGTTSPYSDSQLYVEYSSDTSEGRDTLKNSTKTQLDDLLANATLGGKALSTFAEIEENKTIERQETTNSGINTVYYGYYRVNFDKAFEKRNSKGEITSYEMIKYNDVETSADEFFNRETLNTLGYTFNIRVDLSLKDSVRVNADQPNVMSLVAATAVATGIAALYLLLRYRLSRGLASLAITVLTVGSSAGLFSLLHFLPATSYASVALPFIALFTFALGIIYMNKEREMVLEDRSRDNSVENRNNLMKRAVGISSTPMTIAFIIALYLGVNFFGFMPSSVSWIFLLVILGVSLATAFALTLYGPCAQLLFKWFSKVNIARPQLKKKKKARPVRVNKSAEPEEAIFIGIND